MPPVQEQQQLQDQLAPIYSAIENGQESSIIKLVNSLHPALAGGIFLTIITDVVGFFAFLGLASVMVI